MNFIERIFGVSPDAGSGSVELLLVVLLIVGLAALWRASTRVRAPHRHDE